MVNYQYDRVYLFLRERYNRKINNINIKVIKLFENHYNLKDIKFAHRAPYLTNSYKGKEIHIEGADIKLEYCKWFLNRLKRSVIKLFKRC